LLLLQLLLLLLVPLLGHCCHTLPLTLLDLCCQAWDLLW
jgi:hypothetical protein